MTAIDLVRRADWFDASRAVAYPRLFALAYVPGLAYAYAFALSPPAPDFAAFWAAGKLAWTNAELAYSEAAVRALQTDYGLSWAPFANPPPFLLLVAPFGLAPLTVSLAVWSALTALLFVLVVRRFVGLWPALAFPPGFVNASVGQNGLLTGALFVGAALNLARRPYLAGAMLGALVIKPHLALLVPVALFAGGHWRAVIGASAAACGLLGAALLVFGPGPYQAFLSRLPQQGQAIIANPDLIGKMQSPFAMLAWLGTGPALAFQAAVTLAMVSLVAWAWRRPGDLLGKTAVLATATALASPYLYAYDLMLLLLPIGWVIREGGRTGYLPWERAAVGIAFVGNFAAALAGRLTGVSFGCLVTALLLVVVLRRLHRRSVPSLEQPGGELRRA